MKKQPITPKEATRLLSRMEVIEFAVEAAACQDNGPLTSSPAQRRNMALILRSTAAKFTDLATQIDPLGTVPIHQDIPFPSVS